MPSASTIRLSIESTLARKIPSALSPRPTINHPTIETGIGALDDLLQGGLPVGAMSELTGLECSGRTSIAVSLLARITQANKVCAWIDVSNCFDPEAAAAAGVNLKKLLWIRCGVRQTISERTRRRFLLPEMYFTPGPIKKGLHGGGFGPHPRTEVRGLSAAVRDLFDPHCAEPQERLPQPQKENAEPNSTPMTRPMRSQKRAKQYDALEQGIRSADLLLQTGGFSAIVLDMGSVGPEYVSRIELSTWHRYRLACKRTQSSILALTQHPFTKSSSELQLRLLPGNAMDGDPTVFPGIRSQVQIIRRRFAEEEEEIKVVPLRKPPQRSITACWENCTRWTVRR